MIKAALFDLDGVVLDTEPQYSIFWGKELRHYFPDRPGLEEDIKGQTLVQIFRKLFPGQEGIQQEITQRLNAFEQQMRYDYIPGFPAFAVDLRRHHVKTALVTSSNKTKMRNACARRPELPGYFDRILTSEDFAKSKPDPDCYLKGAQLFQVKPAECVGFEDSFNGLKALRAAGEGTVGLATTNSEEAIRSYCDTVIKDFKGQTYSKICRDFPPFQE
ncbi:MAG: HAD family phosphatase [Prevotella sp.]|jgi:HAD superfamily hydrolase (TIGR01509 family)|nr:HAD family phosphatase [Prevotella sp.]MCH4100993.1 HAD family phosphatase [Prevotella sp.]MCH4251829.1 HAD family phosphatase [Prevotella sp.]MCI1324830.1 HAD family phosphatase [Prevotella sp.]MCI1349991.1 HAD family phosphatase [Prevotella sp.]MCI1416197.1 HAD family phosphatase [Prevotella sp.]